MSMHPTKNINLPKLDKIIGRNNNNQVNNYKVPERNYDKKSIDIDVANILKIEGKNSSHNKYDPEQPKRVLERDLKAELRRIYNLKPSPSKQERLAKPGYKIVELPRIG
jgi:hypothetical protein